jgi:hypothetical protein
MTRILSALLIITLAWTSTVQAFYCVDTNISGFSNEALSAGEQITKHAAYQAFQAGIGASLDIAMGQKPSAVVESRLKLAAILTVSGFCAGQVGSWWGRKRSPPKVYGLDIYYPNDISNILFISLLRSYMVLLSRKI